MSQADKSVPAVGHRRRSGTSSAAPARRDCKRCVDNVKDTASVTAVTIDPDRQKLMKLCKDHEDIYQKFEKALNDLIRALEVKEDIAIAKFAGSIVSGAGGAATVGVACAGLETLGASLAVAPFTIGVTLCGAATKAGAKLVGKFKTSVVKASANCAEPLRKFLESHDKLCAALEVSDFKAELEDLVACASWIQHVPAAVASAAGQHADSLSESAKGVEEAASKVADDVEVVKHAAQDVAAQGMDTIECSVEVATGAADSVAQSDAQPGCDVVSELVSEVIDGNEVGKEATQQVVMVVQDAAKQVQDAMCEPTAQVESMDQVVDTAAQAAGVTKSGTEQVLDGIKGHFSQVVGEPAAQVAEGVADLLPEVAAEVVLENFAILGFGFATRSAAKSFKEYRDTKKIKVSISARGEQERREKYSEALQKLMKTVGDKERTGAIGLA